MATVAKGRGKVSQKQRVLSPDVQSPAKSFKGEASKKDLTCSVCLDRLKDPRLLPCLHTYCKGCLQGIVRKSRDKSNIQCPQCRSTHAVPSGGVNELPSDMVLANALDFHLLKEKEKSAQPIPCNMCTEDDPATTYCPTCSKFLCEFCSKAHKRQVDYRDHKTVSLGDLDDKTIKGFERPRRCSHHSGELLKLYCKTCHKLICRDCTLVDHHNHKFGFLKDVRPGIQKQVEASVEMVVTKRKELETHLEFMKNIEKSREDHSKVLEKKINDAFDSYIAKLQSHRKQLLKREMKSKDADLKQIWAQKDFVKMTLASIDSSMHYAAQLCGCSSDLDMLAMSDKAIQQLTNLGKVEWNPASQLQMSLPLVFQSQAVQVVGNVNPVSLDSFSVSISKADLPAVVPSNPVQQQQFQGGISEYSQPPYAPYGQTQRCKYDQLQYYGQVQQTVELGMAVRLVVHVQPYTLNTSPASSSLIIPSISVSKQYTGSVNYVVTHQGEGSWMVTVKPLHGGQYYVGASLQQHPTSASAHADEKPVHATTKPIYEQSTSHNFGRAPYTRRAVTSKRTVPVYSPVNTKYVLNFSGSLETVGRVRRSRKCPQGNNEDGGRVPGSTPVNTQYTFSVSGRPEIGARVRRGPNWPQGNNEDGGIGNRGTVISPSTKQQTTEGYGHQTQLLQLEVYSDSFVYVEWDNGNREQYEWGHIFPIELAPF